jgi:hypothetical protein
MARHRTQLRLPAARSARVMLVASARQRGVGNAGRPMRPQPVCIGSVHTVVTAGHRENTRHSRTRLVLTAYAALSPATNSSCHRHRRIGDLAEPGWANQNLRRLDTSNGCQDHTVLPSADRFRQRLRRTVHARRSMCEGGVQCRSSSRSPLAHGPETALRTQTRRRCRVHRIPSQRP